MLEKTLDPWTARRSNQSILKEIRPKYSLEGLILELKLWYFVLLMRRTDSLEKTLILRKIEGGRRRVTRGWDSWMASPTQWTLVWVNSGSWQWTGRLGIERGFKWLGEFSEESYGKENGAELQFDGWVKAG